MVAFFIYLAGGRKVFRTVFEESYYEGFIFGFVMARLRIIAINYNKSSNLDKIIYSIFAESCPDIPTDLIEKMLKSNEIEDKSEQNKYLKQIYDEYEKYIEETNNKLINKQLLNYGKRTNEQMGFQRRNRVRGTYA